MRLGPKFIVAIGLTSAVVILGVIGLLTALLPPQAVIVSVGGIICFSLTLLWIEAGVAILIFVVPWTVQYKLFELSGAPVEIGTDDFLIFSVIFGWLGFSAINKEHILTHSCLDWPIAAFFIASLISLFPLVATKGSDTSMVVVLHLFKWFEYTLIYFVIVRVAGNWERIRVFLYLALISAGVVAVVQVFMMVTKQYTGIQYVAGEVSYRSVPGFESNGILGAYYVFFLGITLALIYNSVSYLRWGLLIGYAVLLSFCMFLTFSRAAYVGLVAALITIAVIGTNIRFRITLVVFMVVMITIAVLMKPIMNRILMTVIPATPQSVKMFDLRDISVIQGALSNKAASGIVALDVSSYSRLINWKRALKIFVENPVNATIGIGFWGARFHGIFGFSTVHSQYLTVLIETGIIGFGAFCWLLERIIRKTIQLYRRAEEYQVSRELGMGYFAGLVGLLTHAIFGETLWSFRVLGPFWFVTALVIAARTLQEEEQTQVQEADVGVLEEPVSEPVSTGTQTKQFIKRFFQ